MYESFLTEELKKLSCNGNNKILSFYGRGTVFPGYHQQSYKIENSLVTIALTDMEVLEFTKEEFKTMFEENIALASGIIEWFSMYTNMLLIDKRQQNLIPVTQSDLSEILGISRINLVRCLTVLRDQKIISTTRKHIEVINLEKLIECCSKEVME